MRRADYKFIIQTDDINVRRLEIAKAFAHFDHYVSSHGDELSLFGFNLPAILCNQEPECSVTIFLDFFII